MVNTDSFKEFWKFTGLGTGYNPGYIGDHESGTALDLWFAPIKKK